MTTKPSTFARLSRAFAFFAAATMALPLFADMPVPVAVWDGASVAHDFSSLSQTSGGFTYTLNLNTNTRASDNSYIQIGNNNQKAAVTITADATGAFGTDGAVSVIIKCEGMNLTDDANRGIIGLIDEDGGFYSGDNNVKIAIVTHNNVANGAGYYVAAFGNGVINDRYGNSSVKFTTGNQTVAMTRSCTSGVYAYLNGNEKGKFPGLLYNDWTSPDGVVIGGMDKDGSTRAYAQTGMKIKAVAIFTSTLTAEEVSSYSSSGFPSYDHVKVSSDTDVSAINASASASEIYVNVANGVTITGDTTFTASTIHFYCDGSFNLKPPAGNAATFDFENVSGSPRIVYSGALPSVTGDMFTATSVPEFVASPESWTGTIWISNVVQTGFSLTKYGNANSTMRLSDVKGYFANATNDIPCTVELVDGNAGYGLWLNDGYEWGGGAGYKMTKIPNLTGTGKLQGFGNATRILLRVQSIDDFEGVMVLTNASVWLAGSEPKADQTAQGRYAIVSGSINIPSGTTFTLPTNWTEWSLCGFTGSGTIDVPSYSTFAVSTTLNLSSGICFTGSGLISVDGTISQESISQLSDGARVVLSDTGVMTMTGAAGAGDFSRDFSKVSGTGKIRLNASSWCGISTNGMPTTTVLELASGYAVVPPPLENVSAASYTNNVGSLSGTVRIQGNYGSGSRYLRIFQAKDTGWSGTIDADGSNRLKGFIVSPGATSGTLTISGNNSNKDTTLEIESGAKVNLTGTWRGAVTVNGLLTGTGSVTGDVTFGDGSTLKRGSSAIIVSGSVVADSSATVIVDLNGATPAENLSVITWAGSAPAGAFVFKDGDSVSPLIRYNGTSYCLKKTATGLVLSSSADITIESVSFSCDGANFTNATTVTVKASPTGSSTTYTLTVGGKAYTSTSSDGTATFSNVEVPFAEKDYDSVRYAITATVGGEQKSVTSSILNYGSSVIGEVAHTIDENYSTTGDAAAAGGTWATGVTYDGTTHSAGITNNTFNINAGNYLTNDIVTVTTKLKYDSPMGVDVPVEPAPVAAYTLGFDDSVNFTFKVYSTDAGGDPAWIEVSNAGLTPDTNVDYVATMTMNMYEGVFSLNINGYDLVDSAGHTEFAMPDRTKKRIKEIAFDGEGNVTYIKGEDKLCFMVEDATGKRFVSVDDAIAAYYLHQATEPLTLLHGTDPDGLPVGWTGSSAGDTLTLDAVYAVYDTDGSLWAKYATLTNAVAFAPNNSTNKLLKAATESTIAVLDAPGRNLTLDLQTYTLTYDAPVTGAAMIDIGRGASMKILRGAGSTIAHGTTAGPFFNIAYRGYLDEDIGSDPVKGTDYTLGDMMYKHKSKEDGAPATRYVFERRTGFLMINK